VASVWDLGQILNELKFCYSELLKDIYEETLQWAYEGDKMKMPGDIIKKCIAKRKKILVDYESFEHNYYFWKELMMSKYSPQHECTGPCLIPLDSTANRYSTKHKCFVCSRKSNWRCYGCRHFFCYSVPAQENDQSPNIFHYLESCSNKDGPVYGFGEINCWLKAHLSAIERSLPTAQAKNLLKEMEQNDLNKE